MNRFKLDFSAIWNGLVGSAIFAFALWLLSRLMPILLSPITIPYWLAITLVLVPVLVGVAGMVALSRLTDVFVGERDDLRKQLAECQTSLAAQSGRVRVLD